MAAARGRCLIDTNILIYATTADDRRHHAATSVFDRAERGSLQPVISAQNLAEMYPNLTGRKRKPPDSPAAARKKIDSIARLRYIQVVDVNPRTISMALQLCEKYQVREQDYFDVQLVASMLLNDIPTLITENVNDFSQFGEIKVLTPFE